MGTDLMCASNRWVLHVTCFRVAVGQSKKHRFLTLNCGFFSQSQGWELQQRIWTFTERPLAGIVLKPLHWSLVPPGGGGALLRLCGLKGASQCSWGWRG